VEKEVARGVLLVLFTPIVLFLSAPSVTAVCGDGVCENSEQNGGCKADCSGATFFELFQKESFARKIKGFCRQPAHCLVTPVGALANTGKPEKFFDANSAIEQPRCVFDGQFILDHYCQEGSWITRTSSVFSIMHNSVPANTDFHIFCGRHEEVANRLDLKFRGKRLKEYLKSCVKGQAGKVVDCVNNLCVLKYQDHVTLGTSYNVPLSSDRGFLGALGQSASACNGVKDGTFGKCLTTPEGVSIFAHKGLDLVFASTDPQGIDGVGVGLATFISQRKLFTDFGSSRDPLYDGFSRMLHFNNLIHLRKSVGSVLGALERNVEVDSRDMAGLRYQNIQFNQEEPPCLTYVKPLDRVALCEGQEDDNDFIIVRIGPTAPPPSPGGRPAKGIVSLWGDAGAKIR